MAVSREPTPDLRPFVRRLYGFHSETGAPRRLREGPAAEVVLVVSFGPAWRIADVAGTAPPERFTSFVGGLRLTSVVTEGDGAAHGMQASLTALGAFRFFAVPMHELSGAVVPLEALLGTEAARLVERLAETPAWPDRFAVLEEALEARLARGPRPTAGVVWAWQSLAGSHGRRRIGDVAAELGWSRRRLLSRFRTEVGIAPKEAARLLRFERAAALLESPEPPSLAAVAVTCGYYDQAHMAGEFRRIAASTPAHFAASAERPFLQDDAAAGS